jgi:flagellar motor switch protein FliM
MTGEGNEPLLSAEETDALLDAMRSGAEGSAAVENVDLASAERPLRDALSIADGCARALADSVDKLMLRVSGCASSTEELPAEITPYKVVRASIPAGAAVLTFTAVDGSLGILTIGPVLAGFILDRRMGAPLGKDLNGAQRAELSHLDRRLFESVAAALVEIFSRHWGHDPAVFRAGPVLGRSADLPMMAQFEPLLQLTLRVAPDGVGSDQIVFALSSGAVTRAKGLRRQLQHVITPSELDRGRMRAALVHAEIEVSAILGRARSSVREVLALRAGDLLRLDSMPTEPVEVMVGDKVVCRGMPVIRHGNFAMHIAALAELTP